jgi:hypothetical protein
MGREVGGACCRSRKEGDRPYRNQLSACVPRLAWIKGKIAGPKAPLRPGHVWAIRAKLDLEKRTRDLALFNLFIDSTWL